MNVDRLIDLIHTDEPARAPKAPELGLQEVDVFFEQVQRDDNDAWGWLREPLNKS
jgi:hypothetical protein